jgi:hypothetical protein
MHSGLGTRRSGWVAPFGNPKINACLPAPSGLSQVTTSFIASRRQDIHRVLLWLGHTNRTPQLTPFEVHHVGRVLTRGPHSWSDCLSLSSSALNCFTFGALQHRLRYPRKPIRQGLRIAAGTLTALQHSLAAMPSLSRADVIHIRLSKIALPGIPSPGIRCLLCWLWSLAFVSGVNRSRRGTLEGIRPGSSLHISFSALFFPNLPEMRL